MGKKGEIGKDEFHHRKERGGGRPVYMDESEEEAGREGGRERGDG